MTVDGAVRGLLAMVFVFAACSSTKSATRRGQMVDAPARESAAQLVENPAGRNGQLASGGTGKNDPGASRKADLVLGAVHFEFDSDVLTPEARGILQANADAMRQGLATRGAVLRVVIEGHTDDVGTTEYNLALGQRRADAVRRYLVTLGTPEERLQTLSYGEERPLDRETSDGARSTNRRAAFVLQGASSAE